MLYCTTYNHTLLPHNFVIYRYILFSSAEKHSLTCYHTQNSHFANHHLALKRYQLKFKLFPKFQKFANGKPVLKYSKNIRDFMKANQSVPTVACAPNLKTRCTRSLYYEWQCMKSMPCTWQVQVPIWTFSWKELHCGLWKVWRRFH